MKSTTEIAIRNYHIDHFGHVNHARSVELLEEARWRYLEDNHLMASLHRLGALHVVADIRIQYRHPAGFGDILRIETQIKGRSEHRFRVGQKAFLNASATLALDATSTNVFVDTQGRPRPIDNALLDAWPDLALATLDRQTG